MRVAKEHVLLGFCVLAFLILGYFFVKPDLPGWPPYVASSADRDGVKGLFTLLKEKGQPVKEWRQEWRFLADGQQGTLVVIQPAGVSEADFSLIQDWIAEGNYVLWFENTGSGKEWFDVQRNESVKEGETTAAFIGTAVEGGEAASWPAVVHTRSRIVDDGTVEPLVTDEHGIIAARKQVGEGSAALFLVPQWTRNDTILEHGHFELIWPYLSSLEGPIWFDEYYRGLRTQPGILAVYPSWLVAILLQLIIALLLWLWYKGARFSPAYTPREWAVRRGDETLLAAAGWYERRRFAYEALEHQMQYIRHLFRERWGVRVDAKDSQLLAAARLHWNPEDVQRLNELLQSWKSAQQSNHYSSKQLLQDSRRADEFILKLEKE